MIICKEKGCQGKIPRGKSLISRLCLALGYCRYCYLMYYPKRTRSKLPPLRQGSDRLLSWGERRQTERDAFEGREQIIWSPEFRKEWLEYMQAKDRGEVRI